MSSQEAVPATDESAASSVEDNDETLTTNVDSNSNSSGNVNTTEASFDRLTVERAAVPPIETALQSPNATNDEMTIRNELATLRHQNERQRQQQRELMLRREALQRQRLDLLRQQASLEEMRRQETVFGGLVGSVGGIGVGRAQPENERADQRRVVGFVFGEGTFSYVLVSLLVAFLAVVTSPITVRMPHRLGFKLVPSLADYADPFKNVDLVSTTATSSHSSSSSSLSHSTSSFSRQTTSDYTNEESDAAFTFGGVLNRMLKQHPQDKHEIESNGRMTDAPKLTTDEAAFSWGSTKKLHNSKDTDINAKEHIESFTSGTEKHHASFSLHHEPPPLPKKKTQMETLLAVPWRYDTLMRNPINFVVNLIDPAFRMPFFDDVFGIEVMRYDKHEHMTDVDDDEIDSTTPAKSVSLKSSSASSEQTIETSTTCTKDGVTSQKNADFSRTEKTEMLEDDSHSSDSSSSSSSSNSTSWNKSTDVLDKILTSTPRLLAIANLLLAATYLIHGAIADVFLGLGGPSNNPRRNSGTGGFGTQTTHLPSPRGRERLGGFLIFKLLLVSAVVEPDTLDLLILLGWYTLLGFLRSLSHLATGTTTHTSQSGLPPRRGVLRLLLLVFVCDVGAMVACIALFYGAGWGMVLLLTCDNVLLGMEVLVGVVRHGMQVMEGKHERIVRRLEQENLERIMGRGVTMGVRSSGSREQLVRDEGILLEETSEDDDAEATTTATNASHMTEEEELQNDTAALLQAEEEYQRLIDSQMELMEETNARRNDMLETLVFALELVSSVITVCHFLHIWSLHGFTFGLVDGVLALHLHTAVSTAGRKISDRRNQNKIARDLDGLFDDASDLELRKSSAAGDVCCICLGTMSSTCVTNTKSANPGSNTSNSQPKNFHYRGVVKKVTCGHLYHAHCLREVVERARSIEAARCPLCRASLLTGRHSTTPDAAVTPVGDAEATPTNINNLNFRIQTGVAPTDGMQFNDQTAQQTPQQNQQAPPRQNERALFRFSTDGFLPPWLPFPALSFEVVRRAPRMGVADDVIAAAAAALQQPAAAAFQQPPGAAATGVNGQPVGGPSTGDPGTAGPAAPATNNETDTNNNNNNVPANDLNNNNHQVHSSIFRRLLQLGGILPLSPQEETMALEQLVDMFPQYDRADLLRNLRDRGSAEMVVESVLMGTFRGMPRGGLG